MVDFGNTTGYISKVGKDPYGLGRWCWTLYSGNDRHRTRVIVAYNTCKNKKKDSRTTYQQQGQYFIMRHQDLTCPNKLFRLHLLKQLAKWQAAGDRIILFMDHNEYTYNGPLGRALADTSSLGLQEAVLKHTGRQTGATFFRGSKLIGGLWISRKIEIANVCGMPFGYGVGDHCLYMLDIMLKSLIGKRPTKIVRPASGRLNSKIPLCVDAYNKSLEDNTVRHRLIEKLHEVHVSNWMQQEKACRVCLIDRVGKEYMKHAKKVCKKIKCCWIPYSLEASIWIRRAQLYYSLIKLHKGKIRNKGNLKRAARRCNISNPLGLSIAEILLQVEECKHECQFYQEHGKQFRTKHLNKRLRLAQEKGDKEAIEKIAAIIQQEKQWSFWRRLNYVTGKKRTRSATTIQVPAPSGLVTELSTQEPVEDAIFLEVHGTCYTLTQEAPVCNGKLFKDFGYLANTPASRAVLDGTYLPPLDSDMATKELFNKIAAIQRIIPKDSVSPVITPAQWKWYWGIVNKETSSSESGLHIGHYIVGSKLDTIAHYHAARVMVILAHAIQLECWLSGLSVMLEKTLGVMLVTKLRAILLMEVDFNA
jgi:hypothetical protein